MVCAPKYLQEQVLELFWSALYLIKLYFLGSNFQTPISLESEFIASKHLLPLTVSLQSKTSQRLGHPVVSLKYFGDSYLCDNQWSQNEATVMCRELGFSSGTKFYKNTTDSAKKISFAKYLGAFQCSGDETSLFECDRIIMEKPCQQSIKLSLLLCDNGGLDGVHRKTKVRGFPYTTDPESDNSFCNKYFGDLEASVFCKMLGWKHGRTVANIQNMPSDSYLTAHKSSFKCKGTILTA